MNPVPGSAISIADGKIAIDADLLASGLWLGLGLSKALLKAEMRKDIVSGVTGIGIIEDVGRTRLTLRFHTRSWTVAIEHDGNLVESIAAAARSLPANTGQLSPHDFVGSRS